MNLRKQQAFLFRETSYIIGDYSVTRILQVIMVLPGKESPHDVQIGNLSNPVFKIFSNLGNPVFKIFSNLGNPVFKIFSNLGNPVFKIFSNLGNPVFKIFSTIYYFFINLYKLFSLPCFIYSLSLVETTMPIQLPVESMITIITTWTKCRKIEMYDKTQIMCRREVRRTSGMEQQYMYINHTETQTTQNLYQ